METRKPGSPRNLKFHFTIDVDWIPGSERGFLELISFSNRLKLSTTLFVTGRFALEYPEAILGSSQNGFEVGCHGWEHRVNEEENYRDSSYSTQKNWIELAVDAISQVTG